MAGAIWGMTGVEGGGKSAWMALLTGLHLNAGGFCQTFEGFDIYHPHNHNIKLTQTIDPVKWLQMPSDQWNLQTDADEIQNLADSALSGAVFARVANRVLAQRRKRQMSLLYTVQNWQWVHNRIRWLTHYLSICQDLSHTAWGKDAGIHAGEYISVHTFDVKGFATGVPWSQLMPFTVHIKPLWDAPSPLWESYEPTSAFAGEFKLELKKHREVIDLRQADEIHAASPFGRRLVGDGVETRTTFLDSHGSPSSMDYNPIAEHDNFERGMEAIQKLEESDLNLIDDLAKGGASIKTIRDVNKRLNAQRAKDLSSVRRSK